MKYIICILLAAGLEPAAEMPDKAYIDEEQRCELPHRLLPLRQGNAILVDSSGNPFSAWMQMQECLAFNPTLGYLQFLNRGYSHTGDLYVHQTDANFSLWVHDFVYENSFHGNARYPTSVASSGPHISFPVLEPVSGTWGGNIAAYEAGGWFSGVWDVAIWDDMIVHKSIGKQLPTGDIIIIDCILNDDVGYRTYSLDLGTLQASGMLGAGEYWGFDINGGIAYVFYYDPSTLNVYYRTTTDGKYWSAETPWEITYPAPYANSVLDWTQMALTDAGNPILVFDIVDNDDAIYPFSHKTYVELASGATPIQLSDDAYACSWYPTIATGGDYVVVLMHVWTNGLEDSLARHDLFYNWSNDNGATWHTPVNITASVPERPGLAQLSKRLDATNGNFFYFYAIHMVVNLDIFWMIFCSVHRMEPAAWYVGWHPITMPGVEENKQSSNLLTPQLQIYPNPFTNKMDIRYQITEEVDSRQKSVVSIKIFDAAGRLVKSFSRTTLDALRPAHITWQGDDDFGRPLPAGVYFVQLKNGKISVCRKIIKLE